MSKNKEKLTDKHVKISPDRHKELKILSAKLGMDMKDVINEAFDLYCKEKNFKRKE